MLVDTRTELTVIPKPVKIPCCRVDKVGAYGLFFARRHGVARIAPGTNYLTAMTQWRAMWSRK